jgi:copper transport protein
VSGRREGSATAPPDAAAARGVPRSPGHWLRSTLVLVAALVLAWSSPVAAHAVLLATEPANGAVLETAPSEIVLRFSEPVSPIRVRLLDAAGDDQVSADAVGRVGQDVRVAIATRLDDGTYLVSWRVTSLDAHPVGGALTFSVGAAGPVSEAALRTATANIWLLPERVFRAAWYALALGAAGAALFRLSWIPRCAGWCVGWPARPRSWAWPGSGCTARR